VEAGMPRLDTLWRLEVGVQVLPVVRLTGIYRLCWRGRCAEVEVAARGRVCETSECRGFLERQLNGRWSAVVAEASPAVWRPELRVADGPPELWEVLEKVEPLPGCWYSRELNYQTDAVKRVLAGAPGVENRREWWAVYAAEGALVVLLEPKVLIICLRPECDRSRCLSIPCCGFTTQT